MRAKQGRRARRLLMRRGSPAHHILMLDGGREAGGSAAYGRPVTLTAKAQSTSVRVHIKPDEFSQLLWGAQSWRRPH